MAKQARGRPIKDESGKTQEQLADESGYSLSTWKEQQKRKDLGGVAGADLADAKRRAETERIYVGTGREIRLFEILDERFLPRDKVEEGLRIIGALENQYDAAICSELPSLLAGLSPADMEKQLIAFTNSWKEQRADSKSALYKECRDCIQKEWIRGDLKKAVAKRK